MATRRLWIMDGHNMIFAIPPLQRLQVSGRREEARAGLADRLEQFAIARGEKVLVVFDGNQMQANPEAAGRPLFQVIYTRRGEGVADVRIIREARAGLERGLPITVVTNDVSTLARNLPRGVRHLGVEEFWLKHVEKRRAGRDGGEGDKRITGDFSDIEREMLREAAMAEPVFQVREPARQPALAGRGVPSPAGPETPPGGTGEDALADRIRLKRERGRLRQERRLGRYATQRRRR